MPPASCRIAAQRHTCSHRSADDDRDEIRPSRAQEVAQPDQRAGQQRQGLSRLLEHSYDLRHHVDQQAGDDRDRHDRDQDGVKQREPGFLFQRLARVEIVGKMLQHRRQRARLLAAIAEASAFIVLNHFGFDSGKHLLRHRVCGLFDQSVERLLDRQAGLEQCRHLPGHQAQPGR